MALTGNAESDSYHTEAAVQVDGSFQHPSSNVILVFYATDFPI
jgi:hypothetical protein